jgi:hypothetical protein
MHGGAPTGPKNGNYKHGRYTKEVAATRSWLREATQMLREVNRDLGPLSVKMRSFLVCLTCPWTAQDGELASTYTSTKGSVTSLRSP